MNQHYYSILYKKKEEKREINGLRTFLHNSLGVHDCRIEFVKKSKIVSPEHDVRATSYKLKTASRLGGV